MQSCKMVYPLHTYVFPTGVPERPEKISRAFGPVNEKTSVTRVRTLQG